MNPLASPSRRVLLAGAAAAARYSSSRSLLRSGGGGAYVCGCRAGGGIAPPTPPPAAAAAAAAGIATRTVSSSSSSSSLLLSPVPLSSSSQRRWRRRLPASGHPYCMTARGLAASSGGDKKEEGIVAAAEAKAGDDTAADGVVVEEGHSAHPLTGKARPGAADIPGVYHADRRLAIVYTCKVCNTRAVKGFSKQAYDHGVVIVRCPGCDNLHLVADRLGWFEDGSWDVERLLREQGERVVAVNDDNVLSLTPTDIVGAAAVEKGGQEKEEGGSGTGKKGG